jgi:hypothetical protein
MTRGLFCPLAQGARGQSFGETNAPPLRGGDSGTTTTVWNMEHVGTHSPREAGGVCPRRGQNMLAHIPPQRHCTVQSPSSCLLKSSARLRRAKALGAKAPNRKAPQSILWARGGLGPQLWPIATKGRNGLAQAFPGRDAHSIKI